MEDSLIPSCLGDGTAVRSDIERELSSDEIIGSGDTFLINDFLSTDEIEDALKNLGEGGDINYQQWHHMPDKNHDLLPLSRLKIAMADSKDGWTPHYRFPVNSQDRHGTFSFSISPTVQKIKDKLIARTGILFNHAVVLLYRDGKDCIGFHKDKTLDLSKTDPIASISIGQERSYILRDNIRNPTQSHELKLKSGSLLLLGAKTNQEWYHSIPVEKNEIGVRISLTFRVVTTFKNDITGELSGQGASFEGLNWPTDLGGTHIDYAEDVIDFWFGKTKNEYRNGLWWNGVSPEHPEINTIQKADDYISEKWGKLFDHYYDKSIDLFKDNHYLKSWMYSVDGKVALMILFDQFSRQVFRGTAKSFYFDGFAMQIANHLLASEFDSMCVPYKIFTYVAMMHSEVMSIVADSTLGIMKLAAGDYDDYMKKGLIKLGIVSQQHLDVLKKFGKYPHRDVILGRSSTIEELDFLGSKKLPKWMKSTVATNFPKAETLVSSKDVYEQSKLKILVLHSNRQTAHMFKIKTEKYLERQLNSAAIFTYCDAPKFYSPEGEVEDIIKKNEYTHVPNVGFTRAWWNASDDPKTMVYRGMEQSLEYIDSLFISGEYDGIIGFSQGATATGIICSIVNAQRNGQTTPVDLSNISKSLKFAVMISGFYCRDTRPEFMNLILEEIPIANSPEFVKIKENSISIPSFHSWGSDDTLVSPWRSEKLSRAFSNKTISIHPSGHFQKAIRHWPVAEIRDWLQQFATSDPSTNIGQMCDKIFKGGEIDMEYIREIIDTQYNMLIPLTKHIVSCGLYSPNIFYDFMKIVYIDDVAIYDVVLSIARSNSAFWKDLIKMDTASDNRNKFRSILVKLIADEINKEYRTYCMASDSDVVSGTPSNLSLYAPKYNALYRGTRLFHDVAMHLASLINIADPTLDITAESDEKRQKLLSYIQYRRIISKLDKLVAVNPEKPVMKKFVRRTNLEELMAAPLSDYIVNPRAEPIDVSPPDLFMELHEFLQSDSTLDSDEKSFERGTLSRSGILDLCKQSVGPILVGIKNLMNSLEKDGSHKSPKVKHLLLGNNICGNELGYEIGKLIKSGKSALTTCYIAGNNLDKDGIKPVCEALHNNTQIKQLWLKRNPIKTEGIVHIVEMMKYNDYLQVLDLTNTGIIDDGAILVLDNLSHAIKYLYLASNGLTAKTCKLIADNIHKIKLEQISMGCNRLGDIGAKFLADALANPECTLKSIEIASCGISSIGAGYIADALKINTSLEWLNLGFLKSTNILQEVPNVIGSQGAIYIAEMLKVNKTLKALDLTHTGIQQAGISGLAEVFDSNTTITFLNVEQFGIPHNELSRELIRRGVQRNKELISDEELKSIINTIDPPHLEDIKSVYRVQ